MGTESQNEDPGTDNGRVGESLTDDSHSVDQPTADLSAIASHFATSMPEVQGHAIQKAADDAAALADGPTDRVGTRFDPGIHATGADGKGTLTARGTWAVKRGRKAGSVHSVANAQQSSALGAPSNPVDNKKSAEVAASRNAGVAAAEMFLVAAQVAGGEEFAPIKDEKTGRDERAMMREAFANYFAATGKKDIPPGAALGFAMLAYMAPRAFMPQTKARLSGIKAKIAQWWINRKLRKQGLTATVNNSPNNEDMRRKEV